MASSERARGVVIDKREWCNNATLACGTPNKKLLSLINALRKLESGPWALLTRDKQRKLLWHRLTAGNFITTSTYHYYLAGNLHILLGNKCAGSFTFGHWFSKMTRLYKFARRGSREGRVTVLSEFLFDLLLQGVVRNYLLTHM